MNLNIVDFQGIFEHQIQSNIFGCPLFWDETLRNVFKIYNVDLSPTGTPLAVVRRTYQVQGATVYIT